MGTNCDREKNLNEIERQLHEQYATNNNSYLGHIVTLMVGLFAIMGFYGTVYIGSSHFFEKVEGFEHSLSDVCIAAIFAYIVLGIMAYICIYQGMHQRHEQFIVWAIRINFYGEKYNKPKIYHDGFIPHNKKGLSIIQGLCGEFVKIISFVACVIMLSLAVKIGLNIYELHNGSASLHGILICLTTFAVHIFLYFICVLRFKRGEYKYAGLIEEYGCLYSLDVTPNKFFVKNFFIITSLFKIKNKTDENKQKSKSNNI